MKAASHPDVPRPSNEELENLALKVCHAIECCGTSPELTYAVSLAADLHTLLCKPAAVPADFRDRVRLEKQELDEKIRKLTAFIESPKFDDLDASEREDLNSQLWAMTDYAGVLERRISRF